MCLLTGTARILTDLRGAMYYLGGHTAKWNSHLNEEVKNRRLCGKSNAPLRNRTGTHSSHSQCRSKLPARSNTGNQVPRRHVGPHQGIRSRIYCKHAYMACQSDRAPLRTAFHTCSHTPPVYSHLPQCAQQTAFPAGWAELCPLPHHSLSHSSYYSGGSHRPGSLYSAFPMSCCYCHYGHYRLHARGKNA